MELRLAVYPLRGQHGFDNLLHDAVFEVGHTDLGMMLRRKYDRIDADWFVVDVPEGDLTFRIRPEPRQDACFSDFGLALDQTVRNIRHQGTIPAHFRCLTWFSLMSNSYLFTSESVSEGHPDKISDQISDAVLDAILEQDRSARVACETMVKTGMVVVAGEVTTSAWVDIEELVRSTVISTSTLSRLDRIHTECANCVG